MWQGQQEEDEDSQTRRQAPGAAQTHALLPPPGTCRKNWNRLCVPSARFRPPAPPTRAARDPAAPLSSIRGSPRPPGLLPEAWRVVAWRHGLDAWQLQRPGGRDGGERAPAEDAVGSRLLVPPAIARGPVHAVRGERESPQVRALAAEQGGGHGERRVGVACCGRPGTLIMTGWRAVLSHRDPRGGGGGGARPWRGECAAPGPGRAAGLRGEAGRPLEQAPGLRHPLHSPTRKAGPELRQSVVTRDNRSLTGPGAFHRRPRRSDRQNTRDATPAEPQNLGSQPQTLFPHIPFSKGPSSPWASEPMYCSPRAFLMHLCPRTLALSAFPVFLLCPWSSKQSLVHTWQACKFW